MAAKLSLCSWALTLHQSLSALLTKNNSSHDWCKHLEGISAISVLLSALRSQPQDTKISILSSLLVLIHDAPGIAEGVISIRAA